LRALAARPASRPTPGRAAPEAGRRRAWDTPAVLKRYAEAHGATPAGWAFLTGTPAEIREVARRYGVVYRKTARGDVDHTFLTSVIDQAGTLRVQYLGVRFDPDELLADLRSLLRERPGARATGGRAAEVRSR
jgi:hypothetical protein